MAYLILVIMLTQPPTLFGRYVHNRLQRLMVGPPAGLLLGRMLMAPVRAMLMMLPLFTVSSIAHFWILVQFTPSRVLPYLRHALRLVLTGSGFVQPLPSCHRRQLHLQQPQLLQRLTPQQP
jgi:hypothetical protein